VLNQSDLYRNEERLFEDAAGCLLGDSAYRLTNRVIKPYSKGAVRRDRTERLAQFNVHFSSARVRVEHAYGYMKGRFPILRAIPIELGSVEGNTQVVDIIYVICILHNFLLKVEGEIDERNGENRMDHAEVGQELLDVYHCLLNSEWYTEVSQRGDDRREKTQARLGQLKQEWLTDYVLEWLNA
jgi:hypothetical protein